MSLETKFIWSISTVTLIVILVLGMLVYYISKHIPQPSDTKSKRLELIRERCNGSTLYIIKDKKTNIEYLAIYNVGITELKKSE